MDMGGVIYQLDNISVNEIMVIQYTNVRLCSYHPFKFLGITQKGKKQVWFSPNGRNGQSWRWRAFNCRHMATNVPPPLFINYLSNRVTDTMKLSIENDYLLIISPEELSLSSHVGLH
ncbi:hypothetical protein RND71_025065 [Anisodus tanguticus]|uniref:Uncharacterized protein n=1 Tax=Anisodus tanguticus TaxID=243964 RepID=A0AAE1VCA8_9SOLA|nr:hypothetical protein RND71_025065 [Anisodus tanguticus]